MSVRKFMDVVKLLYKKFLEDEITALGAQITYYLILSFFPFLIFFVTLISYTHIESASSLAVLGPFLPESVYMLIQDVVSNLIDSRDSAFISFGMLATIWSASTGALAFVHGINKAYNIKETRPFWKTRLVAILFVFGLAVVIIFSFILIIFGRLIMSFIFNKLGVDYSSFNFWNSLRYIVIFITMTIIFLLFYYYSPNCKVRLADAFPGAIFSTIGWIVISIAFSFYVNNFGSFSKTYGSIGAIIALLVWLYWSSIIVLTGGELNAVLTSVNEKNICKNKERQA